MNIIRFIYRYKYLIGLLLSLVIAVLFEQNIRLQPDENDEFGNVQEIIEKKTKKVDQLLNDIEKKLDTTSLEQLMYNLNFVSENLYTNEGIVLLGYSLDSLVFWTNNSVPVENFKVDNQLYNDVGKLKNGWFIIRHNYIDNYELFGLILIKNEYSYQNEFIKSDFFTVR